MLTYLAITRKYRPRWVVWENVPGVLSSNSGRDFGTFLGGLAECGYGFAYRVLDAQYFGLAQRRKRVFVVGHLGDWHRAAAVLFERASLSGHPAPRREAGQVAAPCLGAGPVSGGRTYGTDADSVTSLIAAEVASALETTCHDYSRADGFNMIAHALKADGFDASEDGTGRGTPLVPVLSSTLQATDGGMDSDRVGQLVPCAFDARQSDVIQYGDMTGPLDTNGHTMGVLLGGVDYENNAHEADEPTGPLLKGSPTGGGRPLPAVAIRTAQTSSNGHGIAEEVAYTLDQTQGQCVAFAQNTRDELREMAVVGALASQPGMKQTSYVRQHMAVRRLTPRECERLQGFPDDYTLTPYRGKLAADGPRYKALGNSMAVPVMHWIGKRIESIDEYQRMLGRR